MSVVVADIKADYILLDDRDARAEALRHGLAIVGTIGIMEAAAERGLIDLPTAFAKLLKTNFRVDRELLSQALERDAARTKGSGEN